MSGSKKRQTMEKMTRERTVKERRARKQEKRRAAAAARHSDGGETVDVTQPAGE